MKAKLNAFYCQFSGVILSTVFCQYKNKLSCQRTPGPHLLLCRYQGKNRPKNVGQDFMSLPDILKKNQLKAQNKCRVPHLVLIAAEVGEFELVPSASTVVAKKPVFLCGSLVPGGLKGQLGEFYSGLKSVL